VRVLAVVPAYRAEKTVGRVVRDLEAALGVESRPIIVVDDGSDDATGAEAERAGAVVLRHETNRGKGAALRTGFARALAEGAGAAVTVDADGQHLASEAARIARDESPREAIVLGVRDLARDGAPAANRFSNAVSNLFLSWFGARPLRDTQCGLRRYPLPEALELGARADGYAFESELVLRAARRGRPIVERPIRVLYPRGAERVTHFHSVFDPARIIVRVVATVLTVPHASRWRRALGAAIVLALGVLLLLGALHVAAGPVSSLTLPPVVTPAGTVEGAVPGLRRFGASYVLERGTIREVGLRGSPEAIGYAHSRLLYDQMVKNEGELLAQFEEAVPSRLARALLVDLARYRYRAIDRGMSSDRLREIAAGALGFSPDPYASVLPTYQRFVYLNALYDISLSFEASPLVGCTSVLFHGEARPEGGVILGRNFDMEAGDVFDREKAVFFVQGLGLIPFASVAWPGLAGVVSGMNAEGVAVVVHGARAGEPRPSGEPVVHALRRVLERARTTADAVRLLAERDPMVSHLVIVADARGDARVVERVPGAAPVARSLAERAAVTNHFEGAARTDPRNLTVVAESSTSARRARADELVRRVRAPADAAQTLAILRDKLGPGDRELAPGDRRRIDADIATHAVIFDTLTRTLWVSEGPHLTRRSLAFDLRRTLSPTYEPSQDDLPALP